MSSHLTPVYNITDPNKIFEAYVYHSFLYYELSTSEISDYDYDELCRRLAEVFHLVKHPQMGLTDRSSLRAGTGFQMSGKYPKWVWDLAKSSGHSFPSEGILPRKYGPDNVLSPILGYVTLVGSRETPQDVLALMRQIGQYFCDTSFRGRSGGAPGADTAFHRGAMRSAFYGSVDFDVYLPNSWLFAKPEFGGLRPDPSNGIYDATTFTDTYESATELAAKARGSFHGLTKVGIQLHTRNVFQVLGPALDPNYFSKCVVFWAEPTGRKGQVRGGTNTAVQLALQHNIPIFNLFLPNTRRHYELLMEEHFGASKV